MRALVTASVVFVLMGFHQPVQAEPLSGDKLLQLYQSCMGGKTTQENSQRSIYCQCVNDGMRSWDQETLENVANAASLSLQRPPAALESLEQRCYIVATRAQ